MAPYFLYPRKGRPDDPALRLVLCLTLTLALTACGGGSTPPETSIDIPTTAPPPTSDTPDPAVVASFQTEEYQANWGLDTVNAAEAYAIGYTGEDIVVAVIDYNFDFSAGDVAYHSASVGRNETAVEIYEAQIGDTATTSPHGHAVAATIAALKDNAGIHGVAFDAEVIGVDYFSGVYTRQVNSRGVLYHISDPWAYAYDQGARIFNKSLGYDESDIISDPPIVSERYSIERDVRVVALGGLLVSSAGNNSDPEPSLSNLNALEDLIEDGLLTGGPGAMIIVGAVDEGLSLSSFSDAAGTGESRFHYMVAPGDGLVFPWTQGLAVGGGTSFAAPYVSGAAAIIMSRWPSLTARETADILFESATDLGDSGVDPVYGQGLLNIEAALQPIGAAKIAVASGKIRPVDTAAISLGPAFGDTALLRSRLSELMILDSYNRDFQIDASGLVRTQSPTRNLGNRLQTSLEWQSASLRINGFSHMNYALSRDRDSIPAFALAGQAEGDFSPEIDAAFEFTGALGQTEWIIGTGRSLTAAIARDSYAQSIGQAFSLTGMHDTALPIGNGLYMAVTRPTGPNSAFWFGVSHGQESINPFHPVAAMRGNRQTTALVSRYTHYGDTSSYSIEVGAFHEEGSLLGSSSTGGISLAQSANTVWAGINAEWFSVNGWSVSASGTLSHSHSHKAANALTVDSIIENIGGILSSSYKLQTQKSGLVNANDTFTLSLHQPLRVEKAQAILLTGQSLDASSGDVLFDRSTVSLTPSGRETALEASYALTVSGWKIQANAAFRRDAGHYKGITDTLLGLTARARF